MKRVVPDWLRVLCKYFIYVRKRRVDAIAERGFWVKRHYTIIGRRGYEGTMSTE